MDLSLKLIFERLSQLTDKVNQIVNRSKKIHELTTLEASDTTDLFIAVSDGTNTGKRPYTPGGVSQTDLENATNLSLIRQGNTSTINLQNVNGENVSSIDLGFLSAKDLLLSANQSDKRLILQDSMGIILSYVSFEDVLLESAHHIHVVTNSDLSQPSIEFKLQNVPSIKEPVAIYINGLFVNPDDFIISSNNVIIARTNIGYEIREGNKITVNYKF